MLLFAKSQMLIPNKYLFNYKKNYNNFRVKIKIKKQFMLTFLTCAYVFHVYDVSSLFSSPVFFYCAYIYLFLSVSSSFGDHHLMSSVQMMTKMNKNLNRCLILKILYLNLEMNFLCLKNNIAFFSFSST